MKSKCVGRRSFCQSLLGAVPALAVGGALLPDVAARAAKAKTIEVPSSGGTEYPKTKVPPKATDCHIHIYESRFPVAPGASIKPALATVDDYRLLQKRLGLSRTVVVQPSSYGLDNSGLLDVLGVFGLAAARGIAVVTTSVPDEELKRMDKAGVRGIRFNLVTPGSVTTMDMVEPMAKRIAGMGWHIQLYVTAAQVVDNMALWMRLPCQVVFDHMGSLPGEAGEKHPAFAAMCELMRKGRAWTKISGVYYDTQVGPPTYADRDAIGAAFVREVPERLVWGSDWPHVTKKASEKPDDAFLLDMLGRWASSKALLKRILVDNPAKLYGFSA